MTDEIKAADAAEVPPIKKTETVKETYTKEYVHDLREESKSLRLKVQALDKEAADKIAAAEAAAAQKQKELQDSYTAKEQKYNERIMRSELKTHAVAAGMIDLEDLALVDMSKLTITEDGDVEGAEDLIKALKEKKAYLFKEHKTSTYTGDKKPEKNKDKEKNSRGVFGLSTEEYQKSKQNRAWRN